MPLHALPLTRDPEYTPFCWEQAEKLGFEAVHFSHRLCHDAHDLLDHPHGAAEARQWVDDLRQREREIWIWTHELHRVPPEFLNDEGHLLFDEADWAGHLRQKYQKFLNETIPGITGLIFTFAETDFEIYKDHKVVSRHSPAERLRLLMDVLVDICREHGVRVAVRDFVYRLQEVQSMAEAIRNLPKEVAVMSKAVPHDWQPFYPPNPLLGACGNREQWAEFDLGLEYEGQQMLPYANLEQTAAWYEAARKKGIRHFCLRLDRYDGEKGQSALTTPWGQLFISAFRAWEKNPATPLEEIYRNWEKNHFPGAAEAVQLATSSLQKMLFPKKNWLANHCAIPFYNYAKSHLVDGNADRLAMWTDAPEHQKIEENLRNLPRAFRLELEEEAREAQAIFAKAHDLLAKNLAPTHPAADRWQDGFRMLDSYLRLLEAYRKAFFMVREFEENPDQALSREEIEQSIKAFERTGSAEAPLWADRYFTRSNGRQLYQRWAYDPQNPEAIPVETLFHPVAASLRKIIQP
ncbi:MAG: hypothetical protein LAT55_04855 [Opitutales bacterium]|nr:hypothetical protein [Opitutales bacterium]